MPQITSASLMLTLAASFSVMADSSNMAPATSATPLNEKVSISKNGSRPWITGSEANFTGTVRETLAWRDRIYRHVTFGDSGRHAGRKKCDVDGKGFSPAI